MKREVVWSRDALDDLGEILDFYAEADPGYAHWLVDELGAVADQLGVALTGHPGRVYGMFEKSVPKLRYILAYEVDRGRADAPVTILRAIHSSRHWPRGGWPE
jgi:plasmid stabilization system protein ParE